MSNLKAEPRPRVLVLGGGFAGIGAARQLQKADVDVVIIDEHNYHTFQPLLYQVATDLLPRTTVGHPLRDLFDDQPNARVHSARVMSVNLEKRQVEFAEMDPLGYDYLVLALGARVNLGGDEVVDAQPGLAGQPAHSPPSVSPPTPV
jgi:NADH dehydrogenase